MLRKIFYGSIANFFTIFVAMVANIVRSALAIRYLPSSQAGAWFIFLNVIILVSFCDFGLSPTLSREIGFAYKKNDPALRISNLFFTVKRLVSLLSLASIIILAGFGYFYFYKLPIEYNQILAVLKAFVLFSVGIVIQFQSNPYLATIYGVGNVATERYIRALSPIFGILISAFLVVKQNYGLSGLAIGYLAQTTLGYIIARYALKNSIKLVKEGKFLKIIVKRILEPSLQWTIMGIGATLVFQISNLLIARIMGVKFVPNFAILLQIAMLVISMAGIIGYVITPFVAKAKGSGNMEMVRYFLTISSRFSTALAIVLAVFSYFFIDPITTVWLGHNFVVHKYVLLLLLIMSVLEAHHVACAAVAMASGYVKFAMISNVAGMLNIILSVFLIKDFGLLGAALSIFISQLLTCNWYASVISLEYLRYNPKTYVMKVIIPLLSFLIYVIAFIFVIHEFINIKNLYVQLGVITCISSIFACIGIWFLLLSFEEKQQIRLKIRQVICA